MIKRLNSRHNWITFCSSVTRIISKCFPRINRSRHTCDPQASAVPGAVLLVVCGPPDPQPAERPPDPVLHTPDGAQALPASVCRQQPPNQMSVISGTTKKAEPSRTDALELWCWRRLLRVTWTARRSNQSILKEIDPEYSLEGLMLKLKLQYFGHLM